MKNIVILIGLIVLSGCGPSAEEKAAMKRNGGKLPVVQNHIAFEYGWESDHYSIIKIGDCEYIKGWASGSDGGPYLTHKGDCDNPIHIYKTE